MCRYDVEAACALCVCLLANAFVLLCQAMMQLSVGPSTKQCVPLLHILMSIISAYRYYNN
ncbi:hypothetical protein J3E69DRAFT_328008 [Trichoderma sp. SZMC 28015]